MNLKQIRKKSNIKQEKLNIKQEKLNIKQEKRNHQLLYKLHKKIDIFIIYIYYN